MIQGIDPIIVEHGTSYYAEFVSNDFVMDPIIIIIRRIIIVILLRLGEKTAKKYSNLIN